jgi:hypothetical protein
MDKITIYDPAKNSYYRVSLEEAKKFVEESKKVALKIKELENEK